MKKHIPALLLFLIVPFITFAQSGTKNALSDKNGFKTLVLGSSIAPIKSKLKTYDDRPKMNADSSYFADYTDTSLYNIGDIKLNGITLRIYKEKILSIIVTFDRSVGSELNLTYIKAFGMYSDRPNRFMDKYYWYSQNVNLMLNYDQTQKLPVAMYTCVPLNDEIEKIQLAKRNKAASDL